MFNKVLPNYTTNTSLSNQLCISLISSNLSNADNNLWISSSTLCNGVLLNFITNTSLAISNQIHVSNNSVKTCCSSFDTVLNALLPSYTNNVSLSNNHIFQVILLNTIVCIVSSNTIFNSLLPNYTTNISLSNRLYISSNPVNICTYVLIRCLMI